MQQTHFEMGEEQGRRAVLREQLEVRFGKLSTAVELRLENMSMPELKALGKAVLVAKTLQDLGLDSDFCPRIPRPNAVNY